MASPAGGEIKPLDVAAIISDQIKYAMAAMPVPNVDAENPPEPFESKNTDETLKKLGVSCNLNLREVDGRSHPSEIKITKLTDFEEEKLIAQVSLLRELQEDIDFLNDFQKELKVNSAMREELNELITGDGGLNLDRFLDLLDNWIGDLEQENPQFISFITQ